MTLNDVAGLNEFDAESAIKIGNEDEDNGEGNEFVAGLFYVPFGVHLCFIS